MANVEKRKGRAAAWSERAGIWMHMRRKDIGWLFQKHSFGRCVPQLLREHRWVFLVGCNNSGTTLIHDVLAATGKFGFMPHEGQRYTDVLRRAHKRGFQRVWTEYLSELQLDERAPTTGVPRLLFDWFGELTPPLQPMILEKTTANAVRMRWLERALPGAAFIGIVRNGYAVVEGIKRKGDKSVARGARHWRLVNEMMLSDAKQVRNFLLVRYEDLVAAPQQTLSGISAFLDLKSNEIWTEFQNGDANLTEDSRISFVDMNAQSISRLNESELEIITQEAGELLARMGYPRLAESQ